MTLRIRNRPFAPSTVGIVLTLLGVLLFVRLGVWQLDRAAQKRALLEQYEAGAATTLELTPANLGTLRRYQRVQARGHYDSEHQVLLDNLPSRMGQPGYRVLTPLQLQGGGWLLVDRGWIPLGNSRSAVPHPTVSGEVRTVTGRTDGLPQPGLRMGDTRGPVDTAWPRVMSYPQHDQLVAALGRPLAAQILLLDPADPDGYERAWENRLPSSPNTHIGYAVQWFAFALLAVVIFVLMSFRSPRKTK